MLASRVTTKYQTTIPLEVREKLGIQQGDMVAFELENGVARLRRIVPLDVEYAKALAGTLSEWASENDEEACRGL